MTSPAGRWSCSVVARARGPDPRSRLEEAPICDRAPLLERPLRFVGPSWALAVPANRVSAIVNGSRAIPADSALRLGKYFGTSPEIWLDLQSDYPLRVARQATWTRVEPTVQTLVA